MTNKNSARLDLTGQRFGHWLVLREASRRGSYRYWVCSCDCGNQKEVLHHSLLAGTSVSCGCSGQTGRKSTKTGTRFGRWVVIGATHNNRGHMSVLCRCDCGTERIVRISGLLNGTSQSCTCLRLERIAVAITTHGQSLSAEYRAWRSAHDRCENSKIRNYQNYGGRGIKVCVRWRQFENFLEDMGLRPTSKHSLDRINVDGDYTPDNCKWSTRQEQNTNTRRSRYITIGDKTQVAKEWVKELGVVSYSAAIYRLKHGWNPVDAVTIPASQRPLSFSEEI